MTRRIHWSRAMICAVSVIAAVAFAATAARAEQREERGERRAPLDGAKRIVVKNARGDVRIEGEPDRGDVRCEYFITARGRKRDEVERVFSAMKVEIARIGDDLVIEAIYPDRNRADRGLFAFITQQYIGMSIDLNISAPSAAALVVSGGGGDIEVAGIAGSVEISAASGDIDARGLGASLDIQVASGDVAVENAAGPLTITVSSGDVELRDVAKNAVVRSASGDISIVAVGGDLDLSSTSGCASVDGAGSITWSGTSGSAVFTGVRGGIKAAAASGDIEITAKPEKPANYEITSSSGDITLVFARALPGGFALKAQTTIGEIAVRLPIQVHKVSRRYLAGVVGEGRSVVATETSSGDITITSSGE